MSWLENFYVLKYRLFKSSSNFFWQFLLQHKHLHSIKLSLTFVYSRRKLQSLYLSPHALPFLSLCSSLHLILWIPLARLLTRFDSKFVINLALSINCNLSDMIFLISFPFLSILATSFSNGTDKVMYFLIFSLKHIKCPSNSSPSSYMIKW